MCLQTKVLDSLQEILIVFFLLFQKNGSVGRWETKHFMGMALLFLDTKVHVQFQKQIKSLSRVLHIQIDKIRGAFENTREMYKCRKHEP